MPFNRFRKTHENEGTASDSGPLNAREDTGDGTVVGRHSDESGGGRHDGRGVQREPSEPIGPSGRTTATGTALTKRRIAPRTPQFGSGLCGYLAAVGCYLVIVAIVEAIVTKIGSDAARKVGDALGVARLNQPATVHWSGAIALLVLAFIACLVGGYVCGTMARAHGFVEGLSVWLWAALAAVVVSLIVEFSSTKYGPLYQIDLFLGFTLVPSMARVPPSSARS
ncbi:hypothetical protein [Flexivirga alba]|uniref:DUF1761 domain-containing protein n=1 Tax=Flexivirga alba TaxID=702742 RepID=A0ABW2AJS8_9MICO